MSHISTPEDYITRVVPEQYAAAVAKAGARMTSQPMLTAIYEIGAERFGLRSAGTQLEVVPTTQLAQPDMQIMMSTEDWRSFANSGATDPFVEYMRRGKVGAVQGLRGRVALQLTRSDGGVWQSATIFGGQSEPAVTLRTSNEHYQALASGELNPQMAFLTGKVKFEGSLPLLMQVAGLIT